MSDPTDIGYAQSIVGKSQAPTAGRRRVLSPEAEWLRMEPSDEPLRPNTVWAGSDPHAQAALFLMESLIHGLIEKSLITAGEAVGIVERAAEVKADISSDLEDTPDALDKTLTLLSAIAQSLRGDLTAD